ncbi:MAG: hemolysin III family protein [Alphaproteobacteria bacterium]|nr:hemolysin III family protein [Alphaproteobacteria bacterium]NNF24135.1 hemolysin III [Paracoccaceae bacterium]
MTRSEFIYPDYARAERIADGTMHVLGLGGAVIGAAALVIWAFGSGSPAETVALLIYGLCLIATFAASAVYHMTPSERARPILRRIDHAAIYLKIAGTYTPLVVMLGTAFSYGILAVVWTLALFGAVRKLFFWRNPHNYGTPLYLIIGWMSVAIIWPLAPTLPTISVWLIAVGGLLYTSGVIFFHSEGMKFSNAIWHGFVVVASGCFYAAIALGIFANA